jgi:hypothetical protein
MYEGELITFLRKWHAAKKYPGPELWPATITFGPQFWNSVRNLHEKTLKEGVEYELSIFSVNRELFVSKPHKGFAANVTTSHTISLSHKNAGSKIERTVLIDGVKVLTETLTSQAAETTSPQIDFIFNLHTHPLHKMPGSDYYSFFSATDISSFLKLKTSVMGLITDRLWLLCKSAGTPAVLTDQLRNLLDNSPGQNLSLELKTGLQSSGLILYQAEFDRIAGRTR